LTWGQRFVFSYPPNEDSRAPFVAPHSMMFKVVIGAATALLAVAVPSPQLRATSAIELSKQPLENALSKVPDLPSIGGPGGLSVLSDRISQIPQATAFFRGQQANGVMSDANLAAWGLVRRQDPMSPAPAPMAVLAPVVAQLSGAPAAAGVPAIGGVAPDPAQFFSRLSSLLTCGELEALVTKTCGSTPLFQAIHQFENSADMCTKAMMKVVELGQLFSEYFGPGAGCQTLMEGWKFNSYDSSVACEEDTRTKNFKKTCRLG
jgi:hypothetical protein